VRGLDFALRPCATAFEETIVSDSFLNLLKKVLVSEEFSYSHQDAERLIGRFPDIVMEGISRGDYPLRDTATALRQRDREAHDDRPDNRRRTGDAGVDGDR